MAVWPLRPVFKVLAASAKAPGPAGPEGPVLAASVTVIVGVLGI